MTSCAFMRCTNNSTSKNKTHGITFHATRKVKVYMMRVKTQRRRISPRTRRRCLAIRGFFKKALDTCTTTSQFFTKCGPTVINEQLNTKIFELEERLNALSNASINQQNNIIERPTIEIAKNAIENCESFKDLETEVLYKTSENRYKRCSSRPSQNLSGMGDSENNYKPSEPSPSNISKSRSAKKQECETNLDSPFHDSDHAHLSQTYSVHDEANEHNIKKRNKHHCSEHRHKHSRHIVSDFNGECNRSVRHKRKRAKRSKLTQHTSAFMNYENNLNQTYIAQIIQNQYEPNDVVDKRVSEISQFSVPICRDRLSLENTSENTLYEIPKDVTYEQKTKLKRLRKTKPKNVTHHDNDLYDFIPVKETSTPKSRRKFVEDQMIANSIHKEVPPSPRTHRPRLNLTIKHYTEYDDYENIVNDNNEMNSGKVAEIASKVKLALQDEAIPKTFTEKETNAYENGNLEKPTTTLNEIKETLQRFLHEVRNEKSFHDIPDNQQQNIGFGASNAVLPMLNSCYYPVVPICPVNYMQSAFVPSTSTCAACAHSNDSEGTVAEQLINQIHQSAAPDHYNIRHQNQANGSPHKRPLTSRSAGSGRILNCCDVNVQIPTFNCISNSSATIGSKIISKECDYETKEGFTDFDMKELNIKLQPVISASSMQCDKNEKLFKNESSRWKRFFKSFGTVKKCKSITRNDDSSVHLPSAKLLHDSPRIMFDCNSLSRRSSNEHVSNMSPYLHGSHYLNSFYLKEVQVKCVATQSERPKRYLFGLFSKRQCDKIIYSRKTL